MMEAETTEKAETVEQNEFTAQMNTCASCKEDVENKSSKLLSCLHTVCEPCLSALTIDAGEDVNATSLVKCPTCLEESGFTGIINNLFSASLRVPAASDGISETEDTPKIQDGCTGCGENTATSYCVECGEYLCDQCVQAHRRVRITKDHIIQSKDNISPESATSDPHQREMHCPLHKQEVLKLYCETCEKLTCRDCQLSEHKDHGYQFMDEAAEQYKISLNHVLEKIREKKTYVENAKALIEKRSAEITEKEQKTAGDIKTFIMKVATELNKRGKQLMVDLQNICKAKKGQLEKKNDEIRELARALTYALRFGEFTLKKNDNVALLYTKKCLNEQLKSILKTRCEVPNPYHIIDMKFGYDPNTPLIKIPQLGAIYVEGVPFNQPNSQTMSTSNLNSSAQSQSSNHVNHTSSSPTNINYNQGQSPAHSNHAQTSARFPINQQDIDSLSSHQKALLVLKMKRMQEQQKQQQLQQHPTYQQQIYQRQNQSTSPSSSTGVNSLQMISRGHSQRLSHLPPQSSCISSSNGQTLQAQRYYQPAPRAPPLQQMQQKRSEDLIKINLSQLQERRMQQVHNQYLGASSNIYPSQTAHTTTNNMQNPIVIQPTSEYSSESGMVMNNVNTSPNQSHVGYNSKTLSDCMHSSQIDLRNCQLKSEELNRPSCTFASSSYPKPEPLVPYTSEIDITQGFSTRSHSSGSRTPTPRAESTTLNSLSNDEFPPSLGIISVHPDLENINNSASSLHGLVDDDSFADFLTGIGNMSGLDSDLGSMIGKSSAEHGGKSIVTMAQNSREDDPSEDWCAVCNNGGNLLCCDGCPKVFHLTCHIPSLDCAPSEDWYCGLCTKDDVIHLEAPDVKRTDNTESLTERERKVCERILLELFCNHTTMPFQEPVSDTVPNYYKIISRPMDLGAVKKKLAENCYRTLESFLKDIQLVFCNCATYNLPNSEVGKAGKIVEALFHIQLKRLVPFVNIESLYLREIANGSDMNEAVVAAGRKRELESQDVDSDDDWMESSQETEIQDDSDIEKRKKKKRRKNDSDSNRENPALHIR